jgi:hypothetical protein
VWITNVAGEHPRLLMEAYPDGLDGLYWEDPAWCRDGTRIAMVGYGGNPEGTPARSVLAIVDVATGQLTVAGELALAEGAARWPVAVAGSPPRSRRSPATSPASANLNINISAHARANGRTREVASIS